MSKDIDYGQCNYCGYRFYTIVEAYHAIMELSCPRCREFIGKKDVSQDVRTAMRI